jgi:hypothetical protein
MNALPPVRAPVGAFPLVLGITDELVQLVYKAVGWFGASRV